MELDNNHQVKKSAIFCCPCQCRNGCHFRSSRRRAVLPDEEIKIFPRDKSLNVLSRPNTKSGEGLVTSILEISPLQSNQIKSNQSALQTQILTTRTAVGQQNCYSSDPLALEEPRQIKPATCRNPADPDQIHPSHSNVSADNNHSHQSHQSSP